MRRPLVMLLFTLASCAKSPAPLEQRPGPRLGTYAGAGRDRLCVDRRGQGLRAGVVAYAKDDTNCSASGALVPAQGGWQLIPSGEGACRIALAMARDWLTITSVPATCAYYCAPGASLQGKRFSLAPGGAPATDVAGDPLC